jgi:hypothetical protein
VYWQRRPLTSLPRSTRLAPHWLSLESIGEWKGREPDVQSAIAINFLNVNFHKDENRLSLFVSKQIQNVASKFRNCNGPAERLPIQKSNQTLFETPSALKLSKFPHESPIPII